MNIEELTCVSRIPLIGQITVSVIAIAIGYDFERKVILIIFYYDERKSIADDEIMSEIASEIYTTALDSGYDIVDVVAEGVNANGKSYKALNGLNGFLFARYEPAKVKSA